ncbi:MAG TPA: tetratricopeptide repeat protein [Acidisarcina sp.]
MFVPLPQIASMRVARLIGFLARFSLAASLLCVPIGAAAAQSDDTSTASTSRAGSPIPASRDFDAVSRDAAAAREAGETAKAVDEYARALALHPNWAEGWWYLGTLQYALDHYSEAVPSLKKLLELAPGNADGWSLLGLCEFETRNYAASLADLEKAASLGNLDDPEIGRVAAYHLAMLLNRNGEFGRAARTLSAALGDGPYPQQAKIVLAIALLRAPLLPQEIDPTHDALLQRTGEVATLLARSEMGKALELFPALTRDFPRVAYLHLAYGIALASNGQPAEALVQLQAEIEDSPASELPLIQVSAVERSLGHLEEARRAAERAVALAPTSAAAHQALSAALQSLGKGQAAAAEARLADSLPPSPPDSESVKARVRDWYSSSRKAAPSDEAKEDAAQLNGGGPKPEDDEFENAARAAAAAEASGNAPEAIRLYEHALQQRPGWDLGLFSLGMVSYSAGLYPQAVENLTRYLERNTADGSAWAVLGLCEFELKDYDNALIHLERGEQLNLQGSPESLQIARYHLGILRNRVARFEEATSILASAAKPAPLRGDVEFAMGIAQLRMPLLPAQVPASSRPLVRDAGAIAVLLQQGRYETAFAGFQRLLVKFPQTPFLHLAYGVALASLSKYDEAAEQMQQELLISPSSEWPNIRLAWIALRQHRAADALTPARRAVALAPDSAEAHYLLGRASLESGDPNTALDELRKADKIAPGSAEVHFALGRAYSKAGQPERAEQERAEFERLNARLQTSAPAGDAYEGPHDAGDLSTP